MPASERAASTFTLAGKARQASVAGPSKMSVSSRRASRSIFRSTTHGAPASPFGGLARFHRHGGDAADRRPLHAVEPGDGASRHEDSPALPFSEGVPILAPERR